MSREANLADPGELDAALASSNPAAAFNPFGDGSNTSQATVESIRHDAVLRSTNGL
jgi:hypothetical protein